MTEKEIARIAEIEAANGFEKSKPAEPKDIVLGKMNSFPMDKPHGIPPTAKNIFS